MGNANRQRFSDAAIAGYARDVQAGVRRSAAHRAARAQLLGNANPSQVLPWLRAQYRQIDTERSATA